MSKSLGKTTFPWDIIPLYESLCVIFQVPPFDLGTATLSSYCNLFDNA